MSRRDRLTQCGFEIASRPFVGVGDRLIYFASRQHESGDGKRSRQFYYIDFPANTLTRSSSKGAEFGVWSIEEALEEFSPVVDLQAGSFLDRLQVMGFKLRECDDSATTMQQLGVTNYWGSIGDGSRWLIHSDSEKLTRFDLSPIRIYRLDGMRLVDCNGSGSIDLEPDPVQSDCSSAVPAENHQRGPLGYSEPQGLRAEPWRPVEYSGRSVPLSLFGD